MFAVNYILCYVMDVLYYALPVVHFENIRAAIEWITGCNPTASLYLRFWYYYSVTLSSLVNAVIHLAVNEIVRENARMVAGFVREKCGGGVQVTGPRESRDKMSGSCLIGSRG